MPRCCFFSPRYFLLFAFRLYKFCAGFFVLISNARIYRKPKKQEKISLFLLFRRALGSISFEQVFSFFIPKP